MRYLDLPPLWLLLCLVVAWISPWQVPWGGQFWLGALPILAATFLVLAAFLEFRRARTTIIPHQQPTVLITSGVFKLTRNPIYLADVLILLGMALIWGRWVGLMLVPVMFVILDRRFIRSEEQRLSAAFPMAFASYKETARRWI